MPNIMVWNGQTRKYYLFLKRLFAGISSVSIVTGKNYLCGRRLQ